MSRLLTAWLFPYYLSPAPSLAEIAPKGKSEHAVESLAKPVYSRFVERYVLDELKQLRIEQTQSKQALNWKILDRVLKPFDRGVSYATDTITHFLYLIAAATSVLVLVDWTSIRNIKKLAKVLNRSPSVSSVPVSAKQENWAQHESLYSQDSCRTQQPCIS